MNWPFSKTYTVLCNGVRKTVYKNADDAFPLSILARKGGVSATGTLPDAANAKVGVRHSTRVDALLYDLDEQNRDVMILFRAAYVAYQKNPCNNEDFFNRQIEKLLERQGHLRMVQLQLDALLKLLKLRPESDQPVELAISIIKSIGMLSSEAAAHRVSESARLAREMAGKGSEND